MRTRRDDLGLTVIELIVTMSLVTILAGMSSQAFHGLKKEAGNAVARQAVHDSRNALSAALIEAEAFSELVEVTLSEPGLPSGADAEELLPGFRVPKNVTVRALHDPFCFSAGCTAESVLVNHCNSTKAALWQRTGDGIEFIIHSLPAAPC